MRFAVLAILFLIKLCLRRNIHALDIFYIFFSRAANLVFLNLLFTLTHYGPNSFFRRFFGT